MRREKIQIDVERDGMFFKVEPGPGDRSMKAPHLHEELELNLVLGGHACYLVRGWRYNLQPRTLLWLFPGQPHALLEVSNDFHMLGAVFRRRVVREACREKRYVTLREADPGLDWLRRLAPDETRRLGRLMEELAEAGNSSLFNATMRYLLLTSLEAFQTAETVTGRNEVHPAVEKAAHILQSEAADLSEDELARRVGLSRSRLSRLFRLQTGVPLVQFRNRQRVDRFLQKYGGGQRTTMLEAALEAGFGSYAQFHRVFRQFTGRAPAEYRFTQT